MTPDNPYDPRPHALNRREFLKRLTLATAGVGFTAAVFKGAILTPEQKEETTEALADKLGKMEKIKLGKRLGNMAVTPISICQDWPADLYAPALALGINCVHKAGYWNSLPEAFKKVPRESYFTDITVDSTPRNPDDEDRAYRQVTESLAKNGLKYYDIMRAHFGWRTVQDMREKRGTYRAFQRLKKEGKARYFGVSQHAYIPYPEIIAAQIQDGLVDAIQLFYSYGAEKSVRDICDKAHRAGIFMSAMKVFATGADAMRADTKRQAELGAPNRLGSALYRHVLSEKGSDGKPIFSTCVSAIRDLEQFEENVGALTGAWQKQLATKKT